MQEVQIPPSTCKNRYYVVYLAICVKGIIQPVKLLLKVNQNSDGIVKTTSIKKMSRRYGGETTVKLTYFGGSLIYSTSLSHLSWKALF